MTDHASRPFLAWMILAPPVLLGLAVCAVEGYRAMRPDAELFTSPPEVSLAAAILHGSVEQAYSFVRAGQDPNGVITVKDTDFAEGRTMTVSPLVLAVSRRNSNAVAMLLSAGARLDLPANRLAICLADEMDDEELREMLHLAAGAAPIQCPEHVLER